MPSHRSIAILILLCAILGFSYSLIVPPFEGPDSGAHMRYIAFLHDSRRLPELTAEMHTLSHELVQQPPLYYGVCAALMPFLPVQQAAELDIANPHYLAGLSTRATVDLPGTPLSLQVPLWIARLVSLVGALITVWSSWRLARVLLPDRPSTALAVASIVGLNPQFLFSAATITNDTWAAATTTLTVSLAGEALYRNKSPRTWLIVGLCAGLAALTKYSGLVVAVPVLILLVVYGRKYKEGGLWRAALWFVAGAVLVAGFWYIRNAILWGSPLPMHTIRSLMTGMVRDSAPSLAELGTMIRWLLRSYWGVFGYGVLAPPPYYHLMTGLQVLALVGLLIGSVRLLLRRKLNDSGWLAIALAVGWFLATGISLVSWMRTMRWGDQGRLLFGAAFAIAWLLVCGWQTLWPKPWRERLSWIVPILFTGLAIWQGYVLYDAYRTPAQLEMPVYPQRTLDVRFEGGMRLIGIDLPQGAAVSAHDTLPVTLYWSADQPIEKFYTLHLHLVGEKDHLLYQYDGVPFQGKHPTRQWVPCKVFADTYQVSVDALPADGLATLVLSFSEVGNGEQGNDSSLTHKVIATAPDGQAIGDQLALTQVRLHAAPLPDESLIARPLATWEEGIELASSEVHWDENHLPRAFTLVWQAQQAIQVDYTVSVQILDAQGTLIAQVDQVPQKGQFPTSTWRKGDVIRDVYELGDASLASWHKVIVLLYDRSGRRLPTMSDPVADHYVLLSNDQTSDMK